MSRFDELSDLDFEELVAALLRAETGLDFRAGIRGRDFGVDVLARDEEDRLHVAQCKHYRESSFAHLRAAARKEVGRAARLEEVASYRFVTSKPLAHRQRDELAAIIAPLSTSPVRVLGGNDLEALLRRHPEVERQHVKLWLAGAGPLDQLLNAAAYSRSAAMLAETRAALPRYVQTQSLAEAREILYREHVCVIAGAPGVGKTTLARMLMLDALERGFQPIEIAPDGLKDAWQLLEGDEPKLFYFDDFLGQTALRESRHHDAELLRLMKAVSSRPRRLFVLTTREYILREAKSLSEALNRDSKDAFDFLLEIENYTRQERARIFYNHISFSDQIDEVARRSLLRDRSYLKVIDHPAYNPRLIEWITGWAGHDLTPEEKEDYGNYCLSVLDTPAPLWTQPFERGLGPDGRALLIALLGMPRRVSVEDAEVAFELACEARGVDGHEHGFLKALKVTDDSFLTTDGAEHLHLSFINPSLIDFLREYLLTSRSDARLAVASAAFFEQVEWLWDALGKEGNSPPSEFAEVFASAIDRTIQARPPKMSRPAVLLNGPSGPYEGSLLEWRLRQVLDFLREMPQLASAPAGRLSDHVSVWLAEIEREDGGLDLWSAALLQGLCDSGVVNEERAARVFRGRIEKMTYDIQRWESMVELRAIIPSAYSDAEWHREERAAQQMLAKVVDDPGGYLESQDEVATIEGLAQAFNAAIDPTWYDETRELLEELLGPEEPDRDYDDDYEPDVDDSGGDFGDDDRDIETLFDRLG